MGISITNVVKLLLSLMIVALILQAVVFESEAIMAVSILDVTSSTDKSSYYIREIVNAGGTVLQGGLPETDSLVSIEIRNPNTGVLLFRTIPIGDPAPFPQWPIEISQVRLTDSGGEVIDSVVVNNQVNLRANVRNTLLSQAYVVVTVTIIDGNTIPLFSIWSGLTLSAGQNRTAAFPVSIPEWAFVGKAQAFVNVFDDFPQNEGTPQSLETQHVFYIARNEDLPYPHSEIPITYTSQPGQYQLHFRMPPDRYTQPGNYSVHSTAVSSPILRGSASTSFLLNSYASPPQAAFTYTPLEVYANMTVTFDGSSSSAEGYNDVITSYEWTIGDIPPVYVPPSSNPTTQHAFVNPGTYIVELNVTDSEGLWSTTSKPITILPEYDPTANFTWLPPTPNVNQSVTFNATSSTPGWSARIPGYAPIVTYRWNFGDGTPVQNTGNPIIGHSFTIPGNFTVGLTITDSVGRTDFTSKTVQVMNETYRIYDLNRDYVIDMRDVAIAAKAFGTSPGDPDWNPDADITGPGDVPDGKVDMRDIALVATHFGETY